MGNRSNVLFRDYVIKSAIFVTNNNLVNTREVSRFNPELIKDGLINVNIADWQKIRLTGGWYGLKFCGHNKIYIDKNINNKKCYTYYFRVSEYVIGETYIIVDKYRVNLKAGDIIEYTIDDNNDFDFIRIKRNFQPSIATKRKLEKYLNKKYRKIQEEYEKTEHGESICSMFGCIADNL